MAERIGIIGVGHLAGYMVEVLAHPERSLGELLDSLATPGGITRRGLKTLEDGSGLDAWRQALDEVLAQLKG